MIFNESSTSINTRNSHILSLVTFSRAERDFLGGNEACRLATCHNRVPHVVPGATALSRESGGDLAGAARASIFGVPQVHRPTARESRQGPAGSSAK